MEKDGCSHPRSLTDSARKRNRKEILANFNKTRINIEHQHDRWMELKKELSVQTHAEIYRHGMCFRASSVFVLSILF
jgi:hypothetical protein